MKKSGYHLVLGEEEWLSFSIISGEEEQFKGTGGILVAN